MFIKTRAWAKLPQASKSVFPVIAMHADSNGSAFPGLELIGRYAGYDRKTASGAIQGLKKLNSFRAFKIATSHGHLQYSYVLALPPKEKGRLFNFRHCVIKGGNWSQLTPTAQAIYPVLRTFAYFDSERYSDETDGEFDYNVESMIVSGEFQRRMFDYFDGELDVVAEYAGISLRSTYNAINSLEQCHLIQKVDDAERQTWKVFISPTEYFPHAILDKCAG